MKVLLLICVGVFSFEFQLTSARSSSASGRGGKKAMWKRLETLVNSVDKLSGKLEYIAGLIRGLTAKKGDCPLIQPAIPVDGICPDECGFDIDCPDDLMCCSNGCGLRCMKPGPTEKDGVCPELQSDTAGICLQECGNDFDCNGDLKCCRNGCGHVCTKPDQDICNQPQVVGPCEALIPRWFFNVTSGLCESFNYGGCYGNGNNFESQLECEKECGGTGCPDGVPLVKCFANPCEVSECTAYPDAICTANYCGGCNADWTMNGKPVNCDDQKGK